MAEEFEDNINGGKEQMQGNGFKTSDAKRKANAKYDKETVQQYTLRVPKGTLDNIKAYCEQKHGEDRLNPKYQSLNTLIIALLEEECQFEIKGTLKETQYYLDSIEAKKEWLATEPLKDIQINTSTPNNKRVERLMNRLLEDEWQYVKDVEIKKYREKKAELQKRLNEYKERLFNESNELNKTDPQS